MYQICNLAKDNKFAFYVVTFIQMKMPTLSAPQYDRRNPIFVNDINISVHILIGFKVVSEDTNLAQSQI